MRTAKVPAQDVIHHRQAVFIARNCLRYVCEKNLVQFNIHLSRVNLMSNVV